MPQEQHPKSNVSELRSFELRNIVGEIQKLLWQVEAVDDQQRSNGGSSVFWDADKPGSVATPDAIAAVLEDFGLKPIDPPLVVGFNSVDEFIQHIAEHCAPPDQRVVEYDDVGDWEEPHGFEREGDDDAAG